MENKTVKTVEKNIPIKTKPDAGTIARTIVLALALTNQMLAMFGYGTIDITEDMIYQVCTGVATIGAALVAWWKNNSYTKEARKADIRMKEAKALKKAAK